MKAIYEAFGTFGIYSDNNSLVDRYFPDVHDPIEEIEDKLKAMYPGIAICW